MQAGPEAPGGRELIGSNLLFGVAATGPPLGGSEASGGDSVLGWIAEMQQHANISLCMAYLVPPSTTKLSKNQTAALSALLVKPIQVSFRNCGLAKDRPANSFGT